MAIMQSSVQQFDGVSPVLRRINDVLNSTISIIENVTQASREVFNTDSIQDARDELRDLESEFGQIDQALGRTRQRMEQLRESMSNGAEESSGLKDFLSKASKIVEKSGIKDWPKTIFSEANNYKMAGNTLQAQTGLQGDDLEAAKSSTKNLYVDNMGENLEDVANSLSTVYQITGRTGAGLEEMTRAGLLLRDTFGFDITESIRTAEMMEKQFGISGGEALDMIIQGTQAGLNKNGDLLDTINEYSVHFRKLGLDSSEMFNMLANGANSGTFSVDKLGDTIKEFSIRAIDGSDTTKEGFKAIGLDANEMAAEFARGGDSAKQAFQQTISALSQMENPIQRNAAGVNLFGTMWEDVGYDGVMALANMNGSVELTTDNLEELNRIKYDDATSALASLGRTINMGFAGVVGSAVDIATKNISNFTSGLQGDSGEIRGVFGAIGFAVGFIGRAIADNWSMIEPIIGGVISALAIYSGYLIVTNGLEIISKGIKIASTIAAYAHAVATGSEVTATVAARAAQQGLNTALLACPITWIIILIIALIAIFYVAVAAVNKFAGTSVSATGIIGAVFGIMAAGIYNTFVFIWNIVAAFINFFYNVWNDPIAAVQILFYDLASNVIACVINMAKAIENVINKIPGVEVSITAGLEDFQGKIEEAAEKVKSESEWKEIVEKKEYLDYGAAAMKGYELGAGIQDKAGNVFDNIKDSLGGLGAGNDGSVWDGINNNTGSTAANTAAMADSMDILDEDLKYMRDAAEQELINRFTLAELKVDVNNNNTLRTQADFEDVNRQLSAVTGEILAVAAEGGHL